MAPPPTIQSRHDSPSAADAFLLPPWATPHSPSPEKEFAANAARAASPRPMQSLDDKQQHRINASLYQRSANSSDLPTIEVTPSPPDSPSASVVDTPPPKEKFNSTTRIQRLAPRPLARAASSVTESPLFALALYFVLNLTLTLYNKIVLIGFPFPYTLTALHAFCGTVGTFALVRMDSRKAAMGPKPLTTPPIDEHGLPNLSTREMVVLCLFSVLYTINIVVSNASLRLVTVPVRYAPVSGSGGDQLTAFLVPSSCPSFRPLLYHRLLRNVPGPTMYKGKVSFPGSCRSRSWLRVRAPLPSRSISHLLQDVWRLLFHGVWLLPDALWNLARRHEDRGHQCPLDQAVSHFSPADKPIVQPSRKQSERTIERGIIFTACLLLIRLQPLLSAHSFVFPDVRAKGSSWKRPANGRSVQSA